MPTSIKGKVVVITGASSGAGRAMALAFARKGAVLILSGRREKALQDAVADCQAFGARAIYVIADVTSAPEMRRLAKLAFEFGGQIDVWVNNAGVLAAGPFDETPVEVHDRVIQTNLIGYLNGAHAVLSYFKEQGHGILINNISVGGWTPVPYAVGYTASKFGLRGYAESLRGELSDWPHIHVCNVYPSFLDTPGMQHAANYTGKLLKPAPPVLDPMQVADAVVRIAAYPRKERTIGGPAFFLRVAHFLLPTLSSRITGKVMRTYLKQADDAPFTNGNLFEPVDYGTTSYGGWRLSSKSPSKQVAAGFLIGVLAGLLLLKK